MSEAVGLPENGAGSLAGDAGAPLEQPPGTHFDVHAEHAAVGV